MLETNRVYQADCFDLLSFLDDESVDTFFLDPPYNMGYKPFNNASKAYKRRIEAWDGQWETEEDYQEWVLKWLTQTQQKLVPGGSILITGTFHNIFLTKNLLDYLANEGLFKFRNFITWFKPNAMPVLMAKQMGCYAYSCEYILYYTKAPGKTAFFDYEYLKTLNDGKQHRDVLIIKNRSSKEARGHPTQKPLELLEILVQAHVPEDGLVVDFFGGSGTTAEAAILHGRNFILGERNPTYIEMILDRIGQEYYGGDLAFIREKFVENPPKPNIYRIERRKDEEASEKI